MSSGTSSITPSIAQRGNSLGDFVAWRWGLLTLWLASGALFLGRAIAGRFPQSLPSLGLIAAAVVLTMWTLELRGLLRGSWRASVTTPRSATEWLGQLLPTLANVLLATGFTVAGAYATGLSLLWVIVAFEVIFGAAGPWTLPLIQRWLGLGQADRGTVIIDHLHGLNPKQTLGGRGRSAAKDPERDDPGPHFVRPRPPEVQRNHSEPVLQETISSNDESAENDELPWLWQDATALQELRYMTLPEDGLCVAGSQRVTLPAAQQTALVHTVFHPPFAAVPIITVEMQEPDTVTIKAAQILPHGIRWELRAEEPAEDTREVQWAFTAASR